MIKIAIVICLAAFTAAEAEADAWYRPYGYSNYGYRYNWNNMYHNNWNNMNHNNWNNMNHNNWNNMRSGYMNSQMGQGFQSYGKRSADAEATPEADADAWYHPYSNWPNYMSYGHGYNMNNMNNMYSMNNMYNMNNMYHSNWPMMNYQNGQGFHSYGKRSADAEATPDADADADSWYHSYSNSGYNW